MSLIFDAPKAPNDGWLRACALMISNPTFPFHPTLHLFFVPIFVSSMPCVSSGILHILYQCSIPISPNYLTSTYLGCFKKPCRVKFFFFLRGAPD